MDLHTLLTGWTSWMLAFALLVVRLAIGICFVVHGLGKLGLVGTGNMQGFVDWLRSLGVPYAHIQARVAMLVELVGGALLAAGLFTRPVAIVLIVNMAVAGMLGHRGAGYLITNDPPGAEYTINLAVICFMFLLLGPGLISLDAVLF
jgi:putative oxidoreductase